MSSTYGDKIKISVFGESHGNGIGVVIDGLPAGFEVDFDRVLTQMARRAPGKDKTATPRKEKDLPKVLSGMLGNKLTGAPLCAVIENTNTKSGDYGNLLDCRLRERLCLSLRRQSTQMRGVLSALAFTVHRSSYSTQCQLCIILSQMKR